MFVKQNICMCLSKIFLISTISVESWRPFRIKMFDPIYTIHVPTAVDFNVTVDRYEILSLYFNPLQFYHEPLVHIEYIFDSGDGKFDMVYGNKTLNICQFLNNRKMDIILSVIFKIGENFGELPKRCPIPKKLYYVKNMKVDTEYFPPVMPEKSGNVAFAYLAKEQGKIKTLMNATISFKIENLFKSQRH